MKNKEPILVMLQLTGGNDYLNTVIPYQDPNYYDNRPSLNFDEKSIHKLNADFAFNPSMLPMKKIFDTGNMAILNGVGWENPTRSHFRAMDIWHTAEPDKVGHEGWVAKIIREIPLPTPRSVICSPNHIKNIVPVTNVVIATTLNPIPVSITTACPDAC